MRGRPPHSPGHFSIWGEQSSLEYLHDSTENNDGVSMDAWTLCCVVLTFKKRTSCGMRRYASSSGVCSERKSPGHAPNGSTSPWASPHCSPWAIVESNSGHGLANILIFSLARTRSCTDFTHIPDRLEWHNSGFECW